MLCARRIHVQSAVKNRQHRLPHRSSVLPTFDWQRAITREKQALLQLS